MAVSVLVTGSTDGLGKLTAESLLDGGHRVIVHARTRDRLDAVEDLLGRGAVAVVGDLAIDEEVRNLAARVNEFGPPDAVIHNAGVVRGPALLAVNVIAPYLLTALIQRPQRLIYLSSAMHHGGHSDVARIGGSARDRSVTYSDTKLFVTGLAAAIARRWPDVLVNAVDPGWVPTRMGGPNAADDLHLGCVTQAWLATSADAAALTSGGYWHHQVRERPHPAVADVGFQDALVDALARRTGTRMP